MGKRIIMPTDENTCYLCGCYLNEYNRNLHHCFHGTANRKIADREGLMVFLCKSCHTDGKDAVHRNKETDIAVQQDAQRVWENKYKESYPYKNHAEEAAREAFRQLFGKSYL